MEAERNTQVQEKVKRNEGKEIKAEMNTGVTVGLAILLYHGCDLTCGWDPFSKENYNIATKLIFHTLKRAFLVSEFGNSHLQKLSFVN